jgi:hypothetical protein
MYLKLPQIQNHHTSSLKGPGLLAYTTTPSSSQDFQKESLKMVFKLASSQRDGAGRVAQGLRALATPPWRPGFGSYDLCCSKLSFNLTNVNPLLRGAETRGLLWLCLAASLSENHGLLVQEETLPQTYKMEGDRGTRHPPLTSMCAPTYTYTCAYITSNLHMCVPTHTCAYITHAHTQKGTGEEHSCVTEAEIETKYLWKYYNEIHYYPGLKN